MERSRALAAVASAYEKRKPLREQGNTAYRICNGRADGVDGLIVDGFGPHWLLQSAARSPPAGLDRLLDLGAQSLHWKQLTREGKASPRLLAGAAPGGRFAVRENGLGYLIDFAAGYSQGLFLDQRDNRGWVARHAGGLSVLNLFAYTCGFGVAAAAGGAAAVVNVDLSRNALAWGRDNYAHNSLPARDADFIFGDVFDWLARFTRRGRQFDLIILDPPTFSKSKSAGAFAVARDYGGLLRRALALLPPDGALLGFANTRGMTLRAFRRQVADGCAGSACEPLALDSRMPGDFAGSDYLKRVLVAGRPGLAAWQRRLAAP